MKVLLIIRREAGSDGPAWVVDAADELTLDYVGPPESLQKALDEDPANTRELWVEIPDGAFRDLWDVPTVTGTVVPE